MFATEEVAVALNGCAAITAVAAAEDVTGDEEADAAVEDVNVDLGGSS